MIYKRSSRYLSAYWCVFSRHLRFRSIVVGRWRNWLVVLLLKNSLGLVIRSKFLQIIPVAGQPSPNCIKCCAKSIHCIAQWRISLTIFVLLLAEGLKPSTIQDHKSQRFLFGSLKPTTPSISSKSCNAALRGSKASKSYAAAFTVPARLKA